MNSLAKALPRNQAGILNIRAKAEDEVSPDNFEGLVQKYQGVVYRQALWLLRDETAAEDAAQETFCRAFFKIHTYRGPSFRAWILRITTNYCLDQLRKRETRGCIPLDPLDQGDGDESQAIYSQAADRPTVEELVERGELMAKIQQGLGRLSPDDRMPILLVDLHEIPYQEAAEIMDIPTGTFKSRLSRARAKLLGILLQSLPFQDFPFAPRLSAY